MTVDKDTFLTTNKKDYKWPYPKPMASSMTNTWPGVSQTSTMQWPVGIERLDGAGPSQPPIRTKPNNYYVSQLVEPYCHCDAHLYDSGLGGYKRLAQKEKKLYQELDELSKMMTILSNDVLDHPCDTDDEKMESIYQTDYIKRGLPITEYKKLMAAVDSPVGIPVKGEVIGLGQGYRDPTKFRYNAFIKPFIDICPQITFTRTPTLVDEWFAPRTGTTEYDDNFSKVGLNIIKSRQQYAEPLPSSRRRADTTCT